MNPPPQHLIDLANDVYDTIEARSPHMYRHTQQNQCAWTIGSPDKHDADVRLSFLARLHLTAQMVTYFGNMYEVQLDGGFVEDVLPDPKCPHGLSERYHRAVQQYPLEFADALNMVFKLRFE